MNENFETLFEKSKYSQEIKKDQIVQADVIDITSDHAILNTGLKSESAVSISQFKDLDGEIEIKIGDTVEVSLEDIEDGEGQTKLSLQKAKNELIEKDVIRVTRQGGRNKCSLYAVTWFQIDECNGKLDVASSTTAPINWKKRHPSPLGGVKGS